MKFRPVLTAMAAIPLLLASNLPYAAEDEPSARTLTENYQDWKLTCIEREKGKPPTCAGEQLLVNESGQSLAIMKVTREESGAIHIILVLPLMFDLTKGVEVNVDGKQPVNYPFNFCNNNACFVIIKDDKTLMARFKKGLQFSVGLSSLNTTEPLALPFSLKGFQGMLASLEKPH